MEQYVNKIMKMMKDEKLFAPQGGPIILAQIENEYNQIQLAYRELGDTYVQWAAKLAVGSKAGSWAEYWSAMDHMQENFAYWNSRRPKVRFYEKPGTECAAFIANNHSTMEATVNWRGQKFLLPPASISILPDCKTVVFNTQQIVSQHNSRNFVTASKKMNWEMSPEPIATVAQIPSNSREMQELYVLLKDTTDYAWYTTSIDLSPYDLPMKDTIRPVVRIPSLGHAMAVFVNDEYIGSQHGSHAEKGFVFEAPAKMKLGANHISLLCMVVGLPDSGAYMEHRYAGPRSVTILGLNTGTIDLSANGWGHRAGLNGEKLEVYTEKGAQKVKWTKATGKGRALTWYKTSFDAPSGRDPCAIRMTGMGKGMVWVNGISIGRHWMSFLSPLGQPTQIEYHIPRAFIKPKNFLVVLEEEPADPKDIEIVTVNRDTICSLIKQDYPGHVKYWDRKGGKLTTAPGKSLQPSALLNCPNYKKISAIEFAGYGNPDGFCGAFKLGQCNAPEAKKVVEDHCLGKISCTVPNDPSLFFKSGDPCPGIKKTLAIQAACSF